MNKSVVILGVIAFALASCASTPVLTPLPTLTPTAMTQVDAPTYTLDPTRSTAQYVATGPFNMQLPGTFRVLGDKIVLMPESGGYRVKIVLVFDIQSATAVDSFMRGQLLASMESDKYPTGRLNIDSKEVLTSREGQIAVTASGVFEVHGQQRIVELPIALIANQGALELNGQFSFKLSDYAITMPMGISSDIVLYKFHLITQNDAPTPEITISDTPAKQGG